MAKQKQKKTNKNEESLEAGRVFLSRSALFGMLDRRIYVSDRNMLGKNSYACVYANGGIYLNKDVYLAPKEWAYVIAHCMLHLYSKKSRHTNIHRHSCSCQAYSDH